jgi:hypothetical protein
MKIKNTINNFILILIAVTMMNVAIAEVMDVNKTAILVEDTVANDPLKLKQAFAQILANNTGENITDILNKTEFNINSIKSGMKHAYFENIPVEYLTEQNPYKYWFNLVMQPDYVQGVIKNSGFSVLPNSRKNIMLWIVKDEIVIDEANLDYQELQLSYAQSNEMTMYWLKHWAEALNMAIIVPELDEQDQQLVSPESIKSLSYEAVEQAINRYESIHNLLLYVTANDESIKIRSGFQIGNNDMQINHYQQSQVTEGELLYAMMADVRQNYANTYKVSAADIEKHTVQLAIDSLDDYDEWVAINKYLTSLSFVKSFDITSVSTNEFLLTAELTITTQAFLYIIARDKMLIYSDDGSINQLRFSSLN